VRWLADENFNNDIPSRVVPQKSRYRRHSCAGFRFDGNRGRRDPGLSHDVSRVTAHACHRVMKGEPMSGVFEVSREVPMRVAVDDILLLTNAAGRANGKCGEGRSRYLPLR
jgi:hypothetical protein